MRQPFDRAKGAMQFLVEQPAFRANPLRSLVRLTWWRILSWVHHPATVNIPAWGVRLFLPPDWRGSARLYYLFRESADPEVEALRALVNPGDTIVDVGGNIGAYTIPLARSVGPQGRVVAFEPFARNAEAIRRSADLSGLTNVTVVQAAVTDQDGEVTFYHHPDSSRNSINKTGEVVGLGTVPSVTLDTALAQCGADAPSLVKIDVEGAEALVLRGADRTMSAMPIIAMELNHYRSSQFGLGDEARTALTDRGYRLLRILPQGTIEPGDAAFPDADADIMNILAVAPDTEIAHRISPQSSQ